MQVTQKNRPIQITTPLGEDVLLFYRMNGIERLSEPFEYQLELLSTKDSIAAEQILGEAITVHVDLADGSKRHFNGHVARFGQFGTKGSFACYRATVRPWLWFLTRAANCRIFQHKTVPDIIKQVFRDQGFSNFKEKLSGSYSSRDYCVQYRESDFNFVNRLMEEEGIYYFFSHESGKHDLVLSDSVSAHDKVPGYEKIPYHQEEGLADRTRKDHIHEWEIASEVQSGVYALTDYDFKKPKAGLLVKSSVTRQHSHASYECFDYPGEYMEMGDGEQLVRHRIEELQAQYEACEGKCKARGLAVGALFALTEHPLQHQNREYLVVSASYSLHLDEYLSSINPSDSVKTFTCGFRAMDRTVPFHPPRVTPRPTVGGPQTAVVVGPSGEEIYVDKYGRVKVQFHWDRYGTGDENSSCWVRVSHPWAGKQWGMISHPRIGQEVIVDFLEGDPDQPIITGRVYNAFQMPPYDLPANMTQSGIKSRSTKGGGTDNFNEFRFEDKKGSELIFLHAEKDQSIEVENDEGHWVGHDRQKTIDRNETTHVKHDRTETVDNNETITIGKNRTETVQANEAITIAKNRVGSVGENETIAIGKNRTEEVGENEEISIGKDRQRTVGQNETINIGKKQTIEVADTRQTTVGKDDMSQVSKKYYLEAGDEITLKTGDASISMKKDGTIQI
jgi:type VI secretion system secreted protein VgrG